MATREPFMIIGETPIWEMMEDRSYRALAGMDIDGDGTGGKIDGDRFWQPHTSYKPDQDSTKVPWIVVPKIFIRSVSGIVIGCKARATNTLTAFRQDCVCADGGPDDKMGEGSIFLATQIGIAHSPTFGGTTEPIILYEIWPDVPAVINGLAYQLQPFRG